MKVIFDMRLCKAHDYDPFPEVNVIIVIEPVSMNTLLM